jgi:hypothetical protein
MFTPVDKKLVRNILKTVDGVLRAPTYFVRSNELVLPNNYFYDMSNDPEARKRITKYFHTKTVDKWLYNYTEFEDLLKYFKVEKSKDGFKVDLVRNLDDAKYRSLDDEQKKAVFRYIEKYFVTKIFIYKTLKHYVEKSKGAVKWYDLVNNSSSVRSMIRHRLRRLIKNTVHETMDKK